jgi:hypothetical protein
MPPRDPGEKHEHDRVVRISLQESDSDTLVALDGKFPGKIGAWARKDIMKRLVAFRETMESEAKQRLQSDP